jgi:hypothetical protein
MGRVSAAFIELALRDSTYCSDYFAPSCKEMTFREQEARGGAIEPEVQLAMFLRFLAGGDPADLVVMFGVSRTATKEAIRRVEIAIFACPDLQIVPPTTDEELSRAAAMFRVRSTAGHGIFDGCVIAVDGIFIKTNKPREDDAEGGSIFHFSGHKKQPHGPQCAGRMHG